MRRLFRVGHRKPAMAPGTVEFRGIKRQKKVTLNLVTFNAEKSTETDIQDLNPFFEAIKDEKNSVWLNVNGLHDVTLLQQLGEQLGIHSLVLEDIAHTNQRSKVEEHESFIFVVLKMLQFNDAAKEITSEQVSFILGKNWVLTFQEKEGDVFDPVRERIKTPRWLERHFKADYLLYCLIDAIVDHYFVVLDKIGDLTEEMEKCIFTESGKKPIEMLHHLRQEALYLRKTIWPMREVIRDLSQAETPLIGKNIELYLRDVYDHVIRIAETVDSIREMITGYHEMYLSIVSNRMNEIMKVLTIIATLFIPPTFIAGVYGMNFQHMPELATQYGYFAVLIVMAASIGSMLIYFKRKNWL